MRGPFVRGSAEPRAEPSAPPWGCSPRGAPRAAAPSTRVSVGRWGGRGGAVPGACYFPGVRQPPVCGGWVGGAAACGRGNGSSGRVVRSHLLKAL